MNTAQKCKTLKVTLPLLSLVIIFSSILFIFSYNSFAEAGKPGNKIPVNPFNIVKNRIVPGSIFKIEIDKDSFDNIQNNSIKISLKYKTGNGVKSVTVENLFFRHKNSNPILFAKMPSWTDITKENNDIRTQSAWRGWLIPYKAEIEILYNAKDKFSLPVEIPDEYWALPLSIVAVVVSFAFIGALKKEEWEESNICKRSNPLNFAITPIGTYSISITQILIWTVITIFGLVYVYLLLGTFLDITAQMLMLLGIGGGTAVLAKMNALSRVKEIPAKFLDLVEKRRTPKLKNLISIGGQPNIYKFQMLAITLFTACMVVVEIIKNYAFPTIPDNLVTLMGISSIVYLGNEVTHENIWDKVKEKIDNIEKYATTNQKPVNNKEDLENLNIPEVAELKNLLNEIYS